MLLLNYSTMYLLTYNDAIRTLFAQCTLPKYRDLSTNNKLCVDIEVECFCDNIIITTRHRYVFFCEYNAQNLVWNWYGSMEHCLPFHS